MMNLYRAQCTSLLFVFSRFNPGLYIGMEVAGRDGELEGILEIRSLQVNFQEEGVSTAAATSVAWNSMEAMGGLFGRQGACLLLTRSVHSDGFRFVAEAGYPCGPVSES